MPAPMSERDAGNKESLVGHARRSGLRFLEGGDMRSAPPASTAHSRHQAGSQSTARRAWVGWGERGSTVSRSHATWVRPAMSRDPRPPQPHGTHVGAERGL